MAQSDDKEQTTKTTSGKPTKASIEKWGRHTMELGFTIVPALLMRQQRRLALNPTQFNLLLQLLDHWWSPNGKVFPSRRTLAERMNVCESTVQRTVKAMETRATPLVKRVERFGQDGQRISNEYDLSGLVQVLTEIAKEEGAVREKRREEDRKRRSRRRRSAR